jgi:hypothetical protein
MENDSIMAGLEVINETKSLLHKSDPRELQVLSQLQIQGQFGPLYLLTNGYHKFVLKIIGKKEIEDYDVHKFAIDEGKTF